MNRLKPPTQIKIMKALSRIIIAVAAALTAVGLYTSAHAQPITNYSAIVADAYVWSGTRAVNNYGASTTMDLRNPSTIGNFARKIYVKADVGSILGAGEVFDNAALNLILDKDTDEAVSINIYGIVDNADLWTESEITWDNAPKNDTGSGSDVLGGTSLLGTVNVASGVVSGSTIVFSSAELSEYLNWTAGTIADPYGNGASFDTFATFIITSSTVMSNVYAFRTKEYTGTDSDPYLTYTVIPEPTTYALTGGLLALGAVLLSRRSPGSFKRPFHKDSANLAVPETDDTADL
jgi:hypothetical protein